MAIASQMNLQEQVNSMNEQIKQILAAQNEMNEKVENQSTRLSMYVPQVQFERAMNRLKQETTPSEIKQVEDRLLGQLENKVNQRDMVRALQSKLETSQLKKFTKDLFRAETRFELRFQDAISPVLKKIHHFEQHKHQEMVQAETKHSQMNAAIQYLTHQIKFVQNRYLESEETIQELNELMKDIQKEHQSYKTSIGELKEEFIVLNEELDKCENNTNGFRMRDNNNNSDAEERRVRDTPQQSSTSNPKRSTGLRRLSTFHKTLSGLSDAHTDLEWQIAQAHDVSSSTLGNHIQDVKELKQELKQALERQRREFQTFQEKIVQALDKQHEHLSRGNYSPHDGSTVSSRSRQTSKKNLESVEASVKEHTKTLRQEHRKLMSECRNNKTKIHELTEPLQALLQNMRAENLALVGELERQQENNRSLVMERQSLDTRTLSRSNQNQTQSLTTLHAVSHRESARTNHREKLKTPRYPLRPYSASALRP